MGLYVATFVGFGQGVQVDAFELVAPAGSYVEILDLRLGQTSEFGDAHADILSLQIIRGYTTAGSGGSANTPAPLMSGAPACASTVKTNNTTVASAGTPNVLLADAFNIMAGYWYYPPIPAYPNQLPAVSERIKIAPSERLVVRIGAPSAAQNLNGTLVFNETGLT